MSRRTTGEANAAPGISRPPCTTTPHPDGRGRAAGGAPHRRAPPPRGKMRENIFKILPGYAPLAPTPADIGKIKHPNRPVAAPVQYTNAATRNNLKGMPRRIPRLTSTNRTPIRTPHIRHSPHSKAQQRRSAHHATPATAGPDRNPRASIWQLSTDHLRVSMPSHDGKKGCNLKNGRIIPIKRKKTHGPLNKLKYPATHPPPTPVAPRRVRKSQRTRAPHPNSE